jgi:hypothetical protein
MAREEDGHAVCSESGVTKKYTRTEKFENEEPVWKQFRDWLIVWEKMG